MSALPTLIHQTAWLLGLIRGLTEQRDVYKRLSCKTCDPFTLPSTFTSIFTLIWDSRRLYHTVFSCLEKCELWIYLYSLFEAFIKGGSEKMPTMISNAASALKLLWRTVSYIQLISPLQSGTLYACVLDQFWSKLCFQHFGMLPHAWKWESLNCSCWPENSKPNLSFSSNIHVEKYSFMNFIHVKLFIIRIIFIHSHFLWSWFPNFAYMSFHYIIAGSLLLLWVATNALWKES